MLTYPKESATAELDQDQKRERHDDAGRDMDDQVRTGIFHVCCGVSYLVLYFCQSLYFIGSICPLTHLRPQRGPVFPHPPGR